MSNAVNEVTKAEEPKQCTRREQLGHALGVLGHDSAYTLWSTWTTPFMTDILQLPAAFLGVLWAGARFFDAFTDVSMGVIADRTKSRWGRFRPWIIRSGPLFCLLMALCFFKPDFLGTVGLCAFAGILYIVTGSIAFTSVDIPFWSLPAAMTSNTTERSKIIGTTTTASGAISGIVSIVMPLALIWFGGATEWSSYFKVAAFIAVFAAIMYICCFRMVKEHVVPDTSQKFSLKLGLMNIFTNQPLLCLQISNIIFLLAKILKGNFNYFYCMYNLGGLEYMTIISLISTIAMIGGSILATVLFKYIGKKQFLFVLMCIYGVSCVIQFFAGWNNLFIIYACNAVGTLVIGAANVCVNAMIADTIEYGEWKTGQRNEAMINSTRCFVTKCVMGISGIIVAAVIGLTGYIPQAAVQTASALNSFHFMITLFGGALMLLALVPMFFYKLTEKRHAEIMTELAARKAAKNDKNQ